MLIIDGSQGEGGGQILRSSLALSIATQTPFRIEGIRAGRKKPGLMRQHLTAVRAAAAICDAEVTGDEIGATQLTFQPRAVRPGHHEFSVGTAGSATLVLQTVLAPLLLAPGPSTLGIEGGTHNPFAPPFDFLARTYLPQVERMGPRVTAHLTRAGFFPAGGGRLEVTIQPVAALRELELVERGASVARRARALVANLPRNIAERELRELRRKLSWPSESFQVESIEGSIGPGNMLLVELEYAHVCEVCSSVGLPERSAERVAQHALDDVRRYLAAEAPVGPYLTDQLLLPMALAGRGRFRSTGLTRHATTHIALIGEFLHLPITTQPLERGEVLVSVGEYERHTDQ